ncbi:MAG: hypothetical protein WD054_02955, partial [Gemmatimonadota bacterium]
MRFHTYRKYQGSLLDALNIQDLLERLADFLLESGFEGGPHHHPWWGWSGDDTDRSMDALRSALLQALMDGGQLTPDMLEELRGEGGNEEVQQRIADMLNELVRRLQEEGYINTGPPPQAPGTTTGMAGAGHVDDAKQAAQQVEFSLTRKGIDFLGYRTLKQLLSAVGRSSFGSHDTPHLATGVEAEAASKPYEFGDTMNLDIPATLKNALARGDIGVPLDLQYGDLMVHQAEYRSSCATVLMLDISHSMILYGEDRFTPAKKVALALSHLIRTQFP